MKRHALGKGRMLIRETRDAVVLTYLKHVSEDSSDDEDNEAIVSVVNKEGCKGGERVQGGVPFFGVYGEVEVNEGKYLLYVKDARKVGVLKDVDVYEAKAGGSICIGGKESPDVRGMVETFFRMPGLFIADGYLWDTGIKEKEKEADANSDFIFNFIPLSRFIQKRADAGKFGVRCIQGFFGSTHLSLEACSLTYTLISRRSWRNTGTRYHSRGADSSGHSANTVETVYLMEEKRKPGRRKDHTFLQCRGSIPLVWEQRINLSYKPPVVMGDPDMSSSVFKKHIEVLGRRYGGFFVINLLDDSGHEQELNQAFSETLEGTGVDFLSVNYHKMIKDPDTKKEFKRALGSILKKNVVVRTNCVDCLDRTNVVQAELGRLKMVEQLGLDSARRDGEPLEIDDFLTEHDTRKLSQLWNNNANTLSMQYTGTSALKNDLTEHGVRTIKGLIKDAISSGKRYVNNNFTDGKMQEIIEVVTGVRHATGNCSRGGGFALCAFVLAALAMIASAVLLKRTMYAQGGLFDKVALLLVVALLSAVFLSRRMLRRCISFPSPRQKPKRPLSRKK